MHNQHKAQRTTFPTIDVRRLFRDSRFFLIDCSLFRRQFSSTLTSKVGICRSDFCRSDFCCATFAYRTFADLDFCLPGHLPVGHLPPLDFCLPKTFASPRLLPPLDFCLPKTFASFCPHETFASPRHLPPLDFCLPQTFAFLRLFPPGAFSFPPSTFASLRLFAKVKNCSNICYIKFTKGIEVRLDRILEGHGSGASNCVPLFSNALSFYIRNSAIRNFRLKIGPN